MFTGEFLIPVMKSIGAMVGSSIAVVFQGGGESGVKIFQRFIIGMSSGFISAPVIVDALSWDHTRADYWLAASTLGGVSSYLVLQFLFSKDTLDLIKKRLSK